MDTFLDLKWRNPTVPNGVHMQNHKENLKHHKFHDQW